MLKGFKFGFNSGMCVEVLFVNMKEFIVRWGIKQVINILVVGMSGGMLICVNGIFYFKVQDYISLIDKIVGVKN